MRRNLIASSVVALIISAQPLWIAPAWAQNQNQNQNQNQTEGQVQAQTQSENQNQNQNQNQGDGIDDGDDGIDDESTPTLTVEEASPLPNHVCFYADPEVTGEAFCAEVGGYSFELSDEWDNRISSIEIVGTIKVTVCTDDNYGDICADFTATATTLPAELDNAISSWKAE